MPVITISLDHPLIAAFVGLAGALIGAVIAGRFQMKIEFRHWLHNAYGNMLDAIFHWTQDPNRENLYVLVAASQRLSLICSAASLDLTKQIIKEASSETPDLKKMSQFTKQLGELARKELRSSKKVFR